VDCSALIVSSSSSTSTGMARLLSSNLENRLRIVQQDVGIEDEGLNFPSDLELRLRWLTSLRYSIDVDICE